MKNVVEIIEKIILFIAGILFVSGIIIGIILFFYLKVQGNLLDRIYRDITVGGFRQINNVPETKWVSYDDLLGQFEIFGCLRIYYKEEYLKDNETVVLVFPDEQDGLKIWSDIDFADKIQLCIKFDYDYTEHILIYEPIVIVVDGEDSIRYEDSEEIYRLLKSYNIGEEEIRKYQKYVLEDVIIRTWVNANGGNFEKEKEKMNRCTLVDRTFDFNV